METIRDRMLRELWSDLTAMVETGDLSADEANSWYADKADQWVNGV